MTGVAGGFFAAGGAAGVGAAGRPRGAALAGRVLGAVPLTPAAGEPAPPDGDAPMTVGDGVWTPFWTLPTRPSESGPTRCTGAVTELRDGVFFVLFPRGAALTNHPHL